MFKGFLEAEDAPEAQGRCKPDAFRTGSQEMQNGIAPTTSGRLQKRSPAPRRQLTAVSIPDISMASATRPSWPLGSSLTPVVILECDQTASMRLSRRSSPKPKGACAPSGYRAASTGYGPEPAGLKRRPGSALTAALTSQPGEATALWILYGTKPLEPNPTLLMVQQRRPF